MNQRQARPSSPPAVQAQACLSAWRGRRRAGGASVLTPLVVVMTLALLALMFPFAVMAPHARIAETLQSLPLPTARTPPSHAFGACGDVCSADGNCRHVVLRDGMHGGDRISDTALLAAESCH